MRLVVVTTLTAIMLLVVADAVFAGEPAKKDTVSVEIRRKSFLGDAQDYYDQNNWLDCIVECKKYLKTWNEDILGLQAAPDVALYLGVSYLGNNNQFDADTYLGYAIKLDRDWAAPYAYMAIIHAKNGFLAKMEDSLLAAAKRGYDVLDFIEKSPEREIKRLSGNTRFILDILNKEKFEFTDLTHDPFTVPLKQVSETKPSDTEGLTPTEDEPLTIPEQRRYADDAFRLWGELRLMLQNIKENEDTNVQELLDIVSKLQVILDLGKERRFTDVEQRRRLNELRRRLEDPETRGLLRNVRLQLFIRKGEDILKQMVQHLNDEEYTKVYILYNKLEQHVRSVPYKDKEFKDNVHWLSTEGGRIDTKAKIREKFTQLILEARGVLLMNAKQQKYLRSKMVENEKKLEEMTAGDWADITQRDIEAIEKKIEYYKSRLHPQSVIINNRVYRIGELIYGQEDLKLTGLDKEFAYFEYLGEKVKKLLPKVLSAASKKASK